METERIILTLWNVNIRHKKNSGWKMALPIPTPEASGINILISILI